MNIDKERMVCCMHLVAEAATNTDPTGVINIVKGVMSLFGEYPLNLLLMAGLAVVGFKIFRSAKKSAG